MRKKVMTTIYITPEQAEGLRRLSQETRVPMAVFIRDAIDAVLKSRSTELQDEASPVDPAA